MRAAYAFTPTPNAPPVLREAGIDHLVLETSTFGTVHLVLGSARFDACNTRNCGVNDAIANVRKEEIDGFPSSLRGVAQSTSL
jgi:hypothetical protein